MGGGATPGFGGAGGPSFSDATSMSIYKGFGGGGGGGTSSGIGSFGGTGGSGGAGIFLHATDIMEIRGEITVNGTSGDNGGATGNDGGGGGGGGSGGGIMLKQDHLTNALVISGAKFYANGGGGGNGGITGSDSGGGGGGGGGGRIKIFYNSSITNTSNTFEFNAGNGGDGGMNGVDGLFGTQGSYCALLIPEFYSIAIPISLTLIVFYSLRRGIIKKSKLEVTGNKGVSL
jgi:hypothetical protein